jgi:hypothetical protein
MTMGFPELIEHLHSLPESKRAEVFDFAEFLVQKNQENPQIGKTLADSSLAEFIKNPLQVDGFTPFSREEANAR